MKKFTVTIKNECGTAEQTLSALNNREAMMLAFYSVLDEAPEYLEGYFEVIVEPVEE